MHKLLKQKLLEIDYLNSISSQLSWDESTQMPPEAAFIRSDIHAYVSGMLQQKSTDQSLLSLIQDLSKQSELSLIEKAVVRNIQKKNHYYSVLPQMFYQELSKSFSEGFQAWEEARKQNKFSIYAPKLAKNITLTKKLTKALGDFETPYDALLNIYEDGLTSSYIDKIFENLKIETIRLINSNSSNIQPILPTGNYSHTIQQKMTKELLNLINFNIDAGILAESTHPFTSSSQPKDVRLTVRYNEYDFTEALYALLHEGGHGLYEQNIQESLYGTGLCTGTAMSIHECCSRMMENQVGRSKEFINYYFSNLIEYFPQLKDISSHELYRIVNKCQASLIRIHADEVSYNLHIIIRYEMEKLMINEDIDVNELPQIWNEKYQQYLGIIPENDNEGILQDIHWSCMLMGYFPSYTLGSIYATQLFDFYKKNHEINYYGDTLNSLVNWMKENVYQFGAIYTPNELINKITKSNLDINPYLHYLKQKIEI